MEGSYLDHGHDLEVVEEGDRDHDQVVVEEGDHDREHWVVAAAEVDQDGLHWLYQEPEGSILEEGVMLRWI